MRERLSFEREVSALGLRDYPVSTREKTTKSRPVFVKLIVEGATTVTDASGSTHWGTTRRCGHHVVVVAETSPNDMRTWKKIKWSGKSEKVPGHPNKRRISREESKKYVIRASLGRAKESVPIWVLSATVDVLTSGTAPKNSARFTRELTEYGKPVDGTDDLGVVTYKDGKESAGKVVAVATISPAEAHTIFRSGWAFKREMNLRAWYDGEKPTAGKERTQWGNWLADDSPSEAQKLEPDSDGKIYDTDAPTIVARSSGETSERFLNFRQWVTWNGERCSPYGLWHWQAQWKKDAKPSEFPFSDVGKGHIELPDAPRGKLAPLVQVVAYVCPDWGPTSWKASLFEVRG
jgi:hypothetical protein